MALFEQGVTVASMSKVSSPLSLLHSNSRSPKCKVSPFSFYIIQKMHERTKRRGKLRKRLNKAYIGSPSNFKHLCHIGWSLQTDSATNIEPELKMIFAQAGITQDHLKDKRTSKKIFETIEKQGGIQAVLKEPKAKVISQVSCMSPSKRTSHHNLIQSLKEEHLKRAHSDYHLTPVSQEALICQIRKGTPLKPVAQNHPPKDEGIVAALKDVIQKRHNAIHASGNEECESDLENEEEWDD
ncbi:uncharacterized protein PHA67_005929 isoform 2-T2 [Liasis olivaceus]